MQETMLNSKTSVRLQLGYQIAIVEFKRTPPIFRTISSHPLSIFKTHYLIKNYFKVKVREHRLMILKTNCVNL